MSLSHGPPIPDSALQLEVAELIQKQRALAIELSESTEKCHEKSKETYRNILINLRKIKEKYGSPAKFDGTEDLEQIKKRLEVTCERTSKRIKMLNE